MDKNDQNKKTKKRKTGTQLRTVTRKAAMLKALEKSLGVVTTACKAAGIHRHTHYLWLETDPEYAKAVNEIAEMSLDYGESQLFKLMDGVEEVIEERDVNGNLIGSRRIKKAPNAPSVIFYLKCKGKSRGYVEQAVLAKGEISVRLPKELEVDQDNESTYLSSDQ